MWIFHAGWQFWLFVMIIVILILWLILGGKKHEFIGITPLSINVDSTKYVDPYTLANITNNYYQSFEYAYDKDPEEICRSPDSPMNLDPVVDSTPTLPPELVDSCSYKGQERHDGELDKLHEIVIPPVHDNTFVSKGEDICRRVMEEIYGVPFKKARPDFLKNPETGYNLELDCYNEELGLAVEYNGEQHYRYPNRFNKDFSEFIKQVRRDQFKVEMCDLNGVYLITVPYNVPHDKIRDYILYYLPENVAARLAQQQPPISISQHQIV